MRTYELELDFKSSIVAKTFPHTRPGLTAAFEEVEKCLGNIVNATILSRYNNQEEIVFKLIPE